MADTNTSAANGKYVASNSETTGGAEVLQRRAPVIDFATREETRVSDPGDPIQPTKLYEFYSPETKSFELDVPLALISRTIEDSIGCLRSAIGEADELEKENYVSLAWSNLKNLAVHVGTWPAFDEALSLLFVSFETHKTNPYRAKELVALQKTLEMLRRNPVPSDEEISIIFDVLQSEGFDLNAPFSKIDLNAEDEDL